MKLFFVALAGAAALAGCGGGQEEKAGATPLNAEPVKVVSLAQPYRYQPIAKPSFIPSSIPVVREADLVKQASPGPATSEDLVFSLEDERGAQSSTFNLQALRGKGFPELKVVLTARRIGDTAPAAPVRPTCRDAGRCEYALARTYTVTSSDPESVQLIARGEGISVVARSLSVDASKAVEITLSADNQAIARRRVVLMND